MKFVRNTSLVEIQFRYEWVELLYANLPHLYANFQNLSALLWGIRDFPSNFFSAFFSIAMAVCAFIEYQIIVDSFRA